MVDFSGLTRIFSGSKIGPSPHLRARLAIVRMKEDGALDRDLALKFLDSYEGEISEKVAAEVKAAA